MAVFLTVLKVLGIVLLVLLAFLLIIMLLVLFVPFRYSFSMFLPDIPFRCPEARHGVFPVHLCYDKGVKTIKNKYLTRAMSRKVHRMRLRKEHFPCPIC